METKQDNHEGQKPKKSDLTGEAVDQSKEMSRSTQTWIIAAALGFFAFMVIGFSMAGPDPKFPMCELGFMGTPDKECRLEASVRHLRGL